MNPADAPGNTNSPNRVSAVNNSRSSAHNHLPEINSKTVGKSRTCRKSEINSSKTVGKSTRKSKNLKSPDSSESPSISPKSKNANQSMVPVKPCDPIPIPPNHHSSSTNLMNTVTGPNSNNSGAPQSLLREIPINEYLNHTLQALKVSGESEGIDSSELNLPKNFTSTTAAVAERRARDLQESLAKGFGTGDNGPGQGKDLGASDGAVPGSAGDTGGLKESESKQAPTGKNASERPADGHNGNALLLSSVFKDALLDHGASNTGDKKKDLNDWYSQ